MQSFPSDPRLPVLLAIEQTETALGEELHKGVCQTLAGTSLLVGALLKNMEKGNSLEIADLRQVGSSLEQAVREMQSLMQPTFLHPEGLMVALARLAKDCSHRVPCRFAAHGEVLQLSPRQARVIYRLARQACAWLVTFEEGGEMILSLSSESSGLLMKVSREIKSAESSIPNDIQFAQEWAEALGLKIEITMSPIASVSVACPLPG